MKTTQLKPIAIPLVVALLGATSPTPAFALRQRNAGMEESPVRRELQRALEPLTASPTPTGLEETVEVITPADAVQKLTALALPNPVGVLGQWVLKDGAYQLNRLVLREDPPSPYSWALEFAPGSVEMPLPQQAAAPPGADTSYSIQIPPDQLLALVQQTTKITRTTVPESHAPSSADTSLTQSNEFSPPLGEHYYSGLEENKVLAPHAPPRATEEPAVTLHATIYYTSEQIHARVLGMLYAAEQSGEPAGLKEHTFAVERLFPGQPPAARSIVVTDEQGAERYLGLQQQGIAVIIYTPNMTLRQLLETAARDLGQPLPAGDLTIESDGTTLKLYV